MQHLRIESDEDAGAPPGGEDGETITPAERQKSAPGSNDSGVSPPISRESLGMKTTQPPNPQSDLGVAMASSKRTPPSLPLGADGNDAVGAAFAALSRLDAEVEKKAAALMRNAGRDAPHDFDADSIGRQREYTDEASTYPPLSTRRLDYGPSQRVSLSVRTRPRVLRPGGSPLGPTPNLHVAGYGPSTTLDDIEMLFKTHCELKSVVMKNGFAFVNTASVQQAQRAALALQGAMVNGSPMIIKYAKVVDDFTLATKNLHVSGYRASTTSMEIFDLFASVCPVLEVSLKIGYAFVNTRSKEAAQLAMTELQGSTALSDPAPVSERSQRVCETNSGEGATATRLSNIETAKDGGLNSESSPTTCRGLVIKFAKELQQQVRVATKDLHVAGYGPLTTPDDIKELFSLCANVVAVVWKHNYCFVNTSSATEAVNAAEKLNGVELDGYPIRINFAKERSPFSSPRRFAPHNASIHKNRYGISSSMGFPRENYAISHRPYYAFPDYGRIQLRPGILDRAQLQQQHNQRNAQGSSGSLQHSVFGAHGAGIDTGRSENAVFGDHHQMHLQDQERVYAASARATMGILTAPAEQAVGAGVAGAFPRYGVMKHPESHIHGAAQVPSATASMLPVPAMCGPSVNGNLPIQLKDAALPHAASVSFMSSATGVAAASYMPHLWHEAHDQSSNQTYYFNSITLETTWVDPRPRLALNAHKHV